MQDEGAALGAPAAGPATMPIRLRTDLPGCSIPYVPYMVPVTWRRSQLSTLVNKVLATAATGEAPAPVPFDFIVNGELLRTSLEECLAQHASSTETTLELEYIRSTLPPAFRGAARQDDWVASIDAACGGTLLTASYDGIVRVYTTDNLKAEPVAYLPAYGDQVSLTCAKWLTPRGDAVATGSMDGTVVIWRCPEVFDAKSVPVSAAVQLRHHGSPVSSLDVMAKGERVSLASAGWDGTVALWDVPHDARFPTQAAASSGLKKRRGTQGALSASTEAMEAPHAPTMVLHHVPASLGVSAARALGTAPTPGTNARTMAAFGHHDECIWSAAWDGSVKCWDVPAGGALRAHKTSDKVPLCLDPVRGAGVASLHELVTGHMDHSLALYDFRDAVKNTALVMAHAHAAPVSAVRTHPTSAHLLASGAYDGRIQVWDLRSPKKALFALAQPQSTSRDGASSRTKVLGLDWTPEGHHLVAGGEDCRVSVYEAQDPP
ncbi:ribosome biogenesis protein ytm1 [Malassezia equina]|uniref:Ribosome biogenesis protein YTM1 n=1 Tax=Malassezia equina TaxID=1381935 RepID=A0AAF0IYZ1_9BASI|nr:ribosome biogenesis protein ytm1 [Malassezia equina]